MELEFALPDGERAPLRLRTPPVGGQYVYARARLPLGATLHDVGSEIVVESVEADGEADKAGVLPGDVLAAISVAVPRMTYPGGNLLLGGVGRPGIASGWYVVADESEGSEEQEGDEEEGAAFAAALRALGTNARRADRSVALVLCRR